jgi:hypothetical protein
MYERQENREDAVDTMQENMDWSKALAEISEAMANALSKSSPTAMGSPLLDVISRLVPAGTVGDVYVVQGGDGTSDVFAVAASASVLLPEKSLTTRFTVNRSLPSACPVPGGGISKEHVRIPRPADPLAGTGSSGSSIATPSEKGPGSGSKESDGPKGSADPKKPGGGGGGQMKFAL